MRFFRKLVWWGFIAVSGYYFGYRYAKMDEEIKRILEE